MWPRSKLRTLYVAEVKTCASAHRIWVALYLNECGSYENKRSHITLFVAETRIHVFHYTIGGQGQHSHGSVLEVCGRGQNTRALVHCTWLMPEYTCFFVCFFFTLYVTEDDRRALFHCIWPMLEIHVLLLCSWPMTTDVLHYTARGRSQNTCCMFRIDKCYYSVRNQGQTTRTPLHRMWPKAEYMWFVTLPRPETRTHVLCYSAYSPNQNTRALLLCLQPKPGYTYFK